MRLPRPSRFSKGGEHERVLCELRIQIGVAFLSEGHEVATLLVRWLRLRLHRLLRLRVHALIEPSAGLPRG